MPSLATAKTACCASTSLLLTLADHETPVWLASALHNDLVGQNLRFHTGLRGGDGASGEDVELLGADAVIGDGKDRLLRLVHQIVQLASLSGGRMLRLTGAGIAEERMIAPQLPDCTTYI
jgi:alpha-D-ribose 1-methylphosphonate 5-triphosphate synthase subunit PhnH